MVAGNRGDMVRAPQVMAGVGGEEAALFASELFSMYSVLAVLKGWSFVVFEKQVTLAGGLRRGSAHISGGGTLQICPSFQ